jgi:TolB protein
MGWGGGPLSCVSDGEAPAWSPDGSQLAYVSKRTGTKEVWIVNPDGTGQRQLTNVPNLDKGHPAWSPDGRLLTYSQFDETRSHVEVWIISADGLAAQLLTSPGYNNLTVNGALINSATDANAPVWCSNWKIVFWSGVKSDEGQIWTMNPDGSARAQLTRAKRHNDEPVCSPDGTHLLFTSDQSGWPELWIMNLDGTGQRPLWWTIAQPLPGNAAWQPVTP